MTVMLHKSHQFSTHTYRWIVVAVLLLVYGLMVSSALHKSATVDEQSHLFRGVAYLEEGATHFLLGHPLFASSLAAVPVLTEPSLVLPKDDPAWSNSNWSVAGDLFLWRMNKNPQRILFLGRLPTIWLTLFLLALVYRWGRELAGYGVALFAFFLLAFDPNVLANGRFISGDIPLTLFFTLTIYGYWRWAARDANWWALLVAGVGLGMASVSKFNAGLLLPILGLLGVYLAWQWRSWRSLLALLLLGGVGSFVIWTVYGFALRPLPGGAFWDDLFWELQYFGKAHGSYLVGNYSTTGWWYYFPFAFVLKSPLPTLLLLMAAFTALFLRKFGKNQQISQIDDFHSAIRNPQSAFTEDILFLLLPAAVYFGVSLTSSLNIGYRYLLPVLPFLWLFTAVSLKNLPNKWHKPIQFAAGATACWLLLQSIFIWPDYIPFFNLLAGGTDKEWQLLSDSNIDWGQDLPALAAWQQETGKPVNLSYFGTAHPSAYGIEFEPMPMWSPAPEAAVPGHQLYDPMNPMPGIYALSVNSLHGVVLGEQRDAFAWFREQEPLARLGKSILLYEVFPDGEPVEVVLAGLEPSNLMPEVREILAGNDLRVRWINGRSAMLWPKDGGWLVVAAGQEEEEEIRPFLAEAEIIIQSTDQTLYRLSEPPPFVRQEPAFFAEALALLSFNSNIIEAADANNVVILTTWEVLSQTSRPLKLFVHALDSQGQIIGQWDGLDIEPTSWQDGDIFMQRHHFHLEAGNSPSHFLVGVYDAETLDRVGEPLLISANVN
ncbi:MAG: phospholipid carrier-dependent glycosyltransferase [Chloroflexi bacterium]|nr:phospholipid carrier-dependent glycosyltransferase [Chloroflexota bacterium]